MARLGDTGSSGHITSSTFTSPASRYTMFCHARSPNAPDNGEISRVIAIDDSGATVEANFTWSHTNGTSLQTFQHKESGGTFREAKLTTSLVANTWYRIGCRYDNTNITAWLNGTQEASTAAANMATSPAPQFTAFANLAGTNWYFEGSIAEAACWDTDLTDDEMAALGKGVSPILIRPQNLIHYWPIIRDPVAFVGDLTESNTTVFDHPPTIYYPDFQTGNAWIQDLVKSASVSTGFGLGETSEPVPDVTKGFGLGSTPSLSYVYGTVEQGFALGQRIKVHGDVLASGRFKERHGDEA